MYKHRVEIRDGEAIIVGHLYIPDDESDRPCIVISHEFGVDQNWDEMANVAYVITHGSEALYKEVYGQMDRYLLKPHVADVSLRPGSAGYHFWRDQFIKTCTDFVASDGVQTPEQA